MLFLAITKQESAAGTGTASGILIKYRNNPDIKEATVVSSRNGEALLASLRNDPSVEWAEPDYAVHASIIPSDTYFNQQWYLQKIKTPAAWDNLQSSRGVVIAVIDSGVDIGHPDLKNNIWTNKSEIAGNQKDDDNNGFIDDVHGWDFVDRNPNPVPKFQEGYTSDVLHGTIVSGLIAAEGNNAAGVSGVTWNAKIMPLRILNDKGEGTAGNVIRAIDYAIKNGANIINLSFVGFNYSQGMDEAIRRAYEAGVIVVAAAGNESGDQTKDNDLNKKQMYPVCLDGRPGENRVIGVAATDAMDQKAYFSGYGSRCVDVTAPGISIFNLSVYAPDKSLGGQPLDKYYDGYWSGTSVATPQVSGVLALIMAANPGLDRKGVINVLLSSSDNVNRLNPLYLNQLGSGRINAAAAVALAKTRLAENKFDLILTQGTGTSTTLNIIDSARTYSKDITLDPTFKGGVSVASGDVDGDGLAEIIVGAGPGGGPHVKIVNGRGQLKGQFMAYKSSFKGGVNVSVGDIDGGTINRRAEIITSPGAGMAPEVRIFTDHASLISKFLAFSPNFDKGVYLTSADADKDGLAEIIVGAGPGGGPHVRVFSYAGKLIESFYAWPTEIKAGVRVAAIRSSQR